MRGRAAKFALDPSVLSQFVAAHMTRRADGGKRTRRYINGVQLDQAVDARIVYRWRTASGEVAGRAAERLLENYNLTLSDLYAWAETQGVKAIIRGGTRNGSS